MPRLHPTALIDARAELAADVDGQTDLFEKMPATGEPPTVLIIDDDRIFRDLLLRFLQKDGFRVVTAVDGTEGLRIAREIRLTREHPFALRTRPGTGDGQAFAPKPLAFSSRP